MIAGNRLSEISAFVEVGRRLSFVRASEQLGLHVSAVSRAVAALESRLGVRLLQRTTRRVGLTEPGRAHLARCEALLAELQEAESVVSAQGGALRGNLRVSIPSGLGLTHITPLLADFLVLHPQLRLDLHLSNRNVDLVEEGFDVALRVGALRDSRLVARRLGDSRRVLAASQAYLDRHAMPKRPADLAGHACLVLDVGALPERWNLQQRGARASVRVNMQLRCNNALALLDACRAGAGIALLPHYVLAADFNKRTLRHVLAAWSAGEQGIFAIYPGNRFIPAKVGAFVDFVEARLCDLAPAPRLRADAAIKHAG